MVEATLKSLLPEELQSVVAIGSAGTYAKRKAPCTIEVEHAMQEVLGIDMTKLEALVLMPYMYRAADLILVVDRHNQKIMKDTIPSKDIRMLTTFGSDPALEEVPDPYNQNSKVYHRCVHIIKDCCEGVIDYLKTIDYSQYPPEEDDKDWLRDPGPQYG